MSNFEYNVIGVYGGNNKLIAPGMNYVEDIWAFRSEIFEKDIGSEDQFAGCMLLDKSSSAEEWIRICSLRKSKVTCSEVKEC